MDREATLILSGCLEANIHCFYCGYSGISAVAQIKSFHDSLYFFQANAEIVPEEVKKLNLGNACYHSVQNLLSSRLLSKNMKIII
jgi:hypothetical protein